jgi:dTDP-4-dehydrorhamnose 3,5-epimerase
VAAKCHPYGVPIIPFSAETTSIEGLFIVQMKQITDERGTVREFYRQSDFAKAGLPAPEAWLQVNVTASGRGAIRGLHGEAMTKFVSIAAGSAFGVYLDARPGSETFGEVVTVELELGTGVVVSSGICNGFQATGEGVTQYAYCFDHEWEPVMDGVAVNPFDPDLAIAWPIEIARDDRSLLSEKDANLPQLRSIARPG